MNSQINEQEFLLKVLGILVIVFFFLLYLIIRRIVKGKRFILSGQFDEEYMLLKKEINIRDLQTGPWQINMQKCITFAGISLSSIILASVFVFEKNLQSYDAYMFNIVLFWAGSSVLTYFVSIQLWFLALDVGGADYIRVKYRRNATIFQTAGWFTLMVSFIYSVTLINTYLGYTLCFFVALSLILMYEYKGKISLEYEVNTADKNEFQNTLDIEKIYIKNNTAKNRTIETVNELRILSWNIERGYDPKAISSYINEVRPDIVCLQEVDWGNMRTGGIDVLEELARDTQMMGLFSIEFFEIATPFRDKRLAGGGVHGNAILTTITPDNYYRISLPPIFDWEMPPKAKRKIAIREKRYGQRFALCVEFNRFNQKIVICSAHLEDKDGGIAGRYRQFSTISDAINLNKQENQISVIAGDFNTFENRLTSLLGIGNKLYRLGRPWAVKECAWWKEKLLPRHEYIDPFTCSEWTFKKYQIYKAKLDYILLSNGHAHEQGIGDFNTSDHRPLWVEIGLPSDRQT